MVLEPKFKQAWRILTGSFVVTNIVRECILSLSNCSGFYTCILQKQHNEITSLGLFRVYARGKKGGLGIQSCH